MDEEQTGKQAKQVRPMTTNRDSSEDVSDGPTTRHLAVNEEIEGAWGERDGETDAINGSMFRPRRGPPGQRRPGTVRRQWAQPHRRPVGKNYKVSQLRARPEEATTTTHFWRFGRRRRPHLVLLNGSRRTQDLRRGGTVGSHGPVDVAIRANGRRPCPAQDWEILRDRNALRPGWRRASAATATVNKAAAAVLAKTVDLVTVRGACIL